MKKIIYLLSIFILLSVQTFAQQVSRATIKTYWKNRVVPPIAQLNSTFDSYWNFTTDGTPLTAITGWALGGNAISTNTTFIGTTTNYSFRICTNGLQRVKVDSIGIFTLQNNTSDRKFWISPYFGYAAGWQIYFGCAVRTSSNAAIGGDSTITVVNSFTDLVLRSRGSTMLTINSYVNNSQAGFTFAGVTTTSNTAATEKQSWNVAGDNIQFATGNFTRNRAHYFQGPTYSSVAASTVSWTSNMDIDAPNNGTNLTQLNRWAIKSNGNSVVTGLFSIGQPTVTPTAQIFIAPLGLTTTSKAPLKMATPGASLMATPESGAFEVDANGTAYYTPVATRYQLSTVLTNTATLDFPNTLAQTNSDLTITVTGASVGDAVFVGPPAAPPDNSSFTAFVSSANTVTLRYNNYSAGAQNPGSNSFKVVVNKN